MDPCNSYGGGLRCGQFGDAATAVRNLQGTTASWCRREVASWRRWFDGSVSELSDGTMGCDVSWFGFGFVELAEAMVMK
ncbi:hypothetical protein M0R45_019187 [Rubus argutus]|uniref:Uncharacterized protein n=1 Tax=Rubus argutus TaxID=59490 RepID=A0AAW1X7E4_RUBAR